ncbi:MAG: winged helix DNA-binding domain-containing protein [Chloroflexota bacterium]|nr:MAG: winged helix DNA-binding domain-containing protein [Chloroflexota bacterium]
MNHDKGQSYHQDEQQITGQGDELPRLSWAEVWARRLDRHGLGAPLQGARPAGIVRTICGAHAQVMSAAELSIGLRIANSSIGSIRDALWNERSLVKTYGPRGTVHILATQDLPMWTGALRATPYGQNADARNELLTNEQAEELIAAIAHVLADAEMTAGELTEALVEHVGPWAGDPVMDAFQSKWPRWRMIQSTAGVRGAFCFGPNRGRNVTYTSPRRWLPGFQPDDEMTALAELVRRYLYAYGPATPSHFARWLAAPQSWAEDLFVSLSGQLEQVEIEGDQAWVAAGDIQASSEAPHGVRLLPYFDAYVVGCHPRERLFPGRAYERALARGQAGNFPVLLIDGIAAGVWHQRRSGRKIEITVESLEEITRLQRGELNEQVDRIGEILEGNARLTIGTVTAGPHA